MSTRVVKCSHVVKEPKCEKLRAQIWTDSHEKELFIACSESDCCVLPELAERIGAHSVDEYWGAPLCGGELCGGDNLPLG